MQPHRYSTAEMLAIFPPGQAITLETFRALLYRRHNIVLSKRRAYVRLQTLVRNDAVRRFGSGRRSTYGPHNARSIAGEIKLDPALPETKHEMVEALFAPRKIKTPRKPRTPGYGPRRITSRPTSSAVASIFS